METVFVNRFDGGIAFDPYGGGLGQFSVAKHFDTLTYPDRLYPLRGMSADTSGTGIGNLLVGSDGNFYGLGWRSADHTKVRVWTRASGSWVALTQDTNSGLSYDCFVEYHTSTGARRLFHSTTTNAIGIIDPTDAVAPDTHLITYSTICQGYVHPSTDILYIGYDNKVMANNNGTWTDVAFTVPANYRVSALGRLGNYLAIGCTPSVSGVDNQGSGLKAKVFLWDQDTSNALAADTLDWGTGKLQVLNGDLYKDTLIGISDGGTGSSVDYDSIVIRAHNEPEPIAELPTKKQTSFVPDASINPRVNFVDKGRLYFSVNLIGGSTSPSYYGLWSLGKSKLTGRYVVNLERVATTGNTETGVIAAAISGDVAAMVHSSAGTLSITDSTDSAGDQWTATSVYESLVNPQMTAIDATRSKQLCSFGVVLYPLPSTGQVVAKYRVDGGAWTTIFTKTATSPDTNTTSFEQVFDAIGNTFTAGREYEFRLESTGFAQIVGYAYKYRVLPTTI